MGLLHHIYQAVLLPLFFGVAQALFHAVLAISYKFRGGAAPTAAELASGKTCRVMRIVHRYKPFSLDAARRNNFWVVHERFLDPAVVLLSNVSLYSADKHGLILVECDQDKDLTKSHPFYYSAQFNHARKALFLSWEDAAKLKDMLSLSEKDQQKIAFLHSPGRCGSTLLSKIFDRPGYVSLSEPDAYTMLSGMDLSEQELKTKLELITLLQCKALKDSKTVKFMMIKFRSQAMYQASRSIQVFPKIHHLFLYRNGIDVPNSFNRAFSTIPIVQLISAPAIPQFLKKAVFGGMMKGLLRNMADVTVAPFNDLKAMSNLPFWPQQIGLMWLSSCHNYVTLVNQGVDITGIQYEKLCSDYETVFTALCARFNLPCDAKELVRVKAVMGKDSQQGTGIGRAAGARVGAITEAEKATLRTLYKQHKAIADSHAVLPNTIGYSTQEEAKTSN